MKVQSGFVLISVLLITTVTTLLALTAIKEINIQERMAGMHSKELNARSYSEKGIIEAKALVETRHAEKIKLADIAAELSALKAAQYEIIEVQLKGNELHYVSAGTFQGASAYLQATLNIGDSASVFDSAVVGCDGVALLGSGYIDSYDSSVGWYDQNFSHANGDVQTINNNADVTLSGDSSIHGDVVANGNFTSSGSAPVIGSLTTAGDVTMSGGTSGFFNISSMYRVSDNVHAGGNLNLSGTTPIGGNSDIVGDVNYAYGSSIAGDLTYGGIITGPTGDHSGLASNIINDARSAPHFEAKSCDPLNIKNEMASLLTLASNGNMNTGYWQTDKQDYHFTPQSVEMFNETSESLQGHPAQSATVFGQENTPVHVFDDFSLKTGQINVSGGDVTVIVSGSFISSGGSSKITVEQESSLTLMVQGEVVMGSDAQIIANGTVTETGKAPFSIYSVYESVESKKSRDLAVTMEGASDTYANIYAPFGNVGVNASGDLMGAIRGKEVDITGAGGVHYDEALGNITSEKGNAAVSYANMSYYYP